jgi:hypothetical protein
MNRRERHVGKSPMAREFYSRYLKKIDCEPTVDDQIALSPSTEGGVELREPTSKRKRTVNTGQKLQEHFQDHWVEWLFGSIVALTAWSVIYARIDLVRIETNQITQKESITVIQSGTQKASDKNQEQDLTLREHSLRISNVEEKVSKTKK